MLSRSAQLVFAAVMTLLSSTGASGDTPSVFDTPSVLTGAASTAASTAAVSKESAAAGYRYLTQSPTMPSDFDQEAFDALWTVWPQSLREKAERSTAEERREMAFKRYGLTTRPDDDSGKPLQYVVDEMGSWTLNCFSCHGGSVYGTPTPGSPNNRFALQTLTEEMGKAKIGLGKLPGKMELGALFIPLGTTNGTTNAVVFGMALLNGRDAKLNVIARPPRFFTHHDMDAPPWWHFHKRPDIYIDGFAQKGHRALMQFTLVPENGPEFYREHENDFRNVYAYLSSLRAPEYPHGVKEDLVTKGRAVFQANCAECHGTYGANDTYPNLRVPIDEIGTDRVRLDALTVEGRKKYAETWFSHVGESDEHETVTDPGGYVAPPLDGVWASPPYFHNGSVPTLWHVLHPSQRPTVWRPVSETMDRSKVGWEIEVVDAIPSDETDIAARRSYFDTRKFGKGNKGHDYPDQLTESEKSAVLEYLKTL